MLGVNSLALVGVLDTLNACAAWTCMTWSQHFWLLAKTRSTKYLFRADAAKTSRRTREMWLMDIKRLGKGNRPGFEEASFVPDVEANSFDLS